MNHLKLDRNELSQKTATFSGEGAYHGSSKNKTRSLVRKELEVPTTIQWYLEQGINQIGEFNATFQNMCDVKVRLPIPSQQEIKDDAVTFVWCPIEQAIQEAGPVTRHVLLEMEKLLERKKRFAYVDSKIQFFNRGDLPVDSKLWHIDGSIAIRDERVKQLGYNLLHDIKARMLGGDVPKYLAYQSSDHCATQFATEPVTITMPECITSFDKLDELVKVTDFKHMAQPAGSIVSFNGHSLHRAVPASDDGWRLWIRCVETDKEVDIDNSIISCYNTVYKVN